MQEKSPILNRPLRILHIISGDLWAGAESQAFTLLKHLHRSTTLHVVLMNDGELSRRLQSLDIPVTIISESEFSSTQILTKLIKIIRQFKPNVLHTHRQKENILGNVANLISSLPFGKRAASVRTSHGAPEFAPKGKQKIQVWLDNWVGKYLQQAVIAVSADLAIKLKAIFPAEKIHIVHNGVDVNELRSTVAETDFRQREPNHIHIGIIGRIESVKRIDIFIEMASQLLNDPTIVNPLSFQIIGDGSLRLEMEKKVGDLGLGKSIFFLGHRADIAACISSLDSIVMCSDHEGTPMTALEALALGTPLIAHEVGGLIEILKDNSMLLVSDHSGAGYAATLRPITQGQKINVSLNAIFSAEQNKKNTLQLYKALMN
ncbi:MAG: glycosyltransferase [Gammaproteobacteria bacterium]|nr:MAG: glycosyltransferase [Gammaproteobacteria bacterium]